MIYLASPYTHPHPSVREERHVKACEYAAKMVERGQLVYCPVAHTHSIAIFGRLPYLYDFWKEHALVMIDLCDELHVLTLDGWKESIGVQAEIAHAEATDKPVTYSW